MHTATANSNDPAERRPLTAVVAEGGGQRGIYTAGVLDAFAGERFNPFDLGIGVSAGAQNLLAFFLERPGYARAAIERLTAAREFYVPYRWLTNGNVIDLDGYFDRTLNDPDFLLDYPRVDEVVQRRRLLFVATCRRTLEPRYLEPTVATCVDCLKASSAVPLLYRGGVQIGEECLIDGGVSDPLPVARALADGAERILMIRTGREAGDVSQLAQRVQRFRRVGALPVGLKRLFDRNAKGYGEAAAAIERAPGTTEIVELRASRPLHSQVFGSRSDALAHDYVTGFADGLALSARLSGWQAPTVTSGPPVPADA